MVTGIPVVVLANVVIFVVVVGIVVVVVVLGVGVVVATVVVVFSIFLVLGYFVRQSLKDESSHTIDLKSKFFATSAMTLVFCFSFIARQFLL